MRVSALARELGRTSKVILARLAELDEAATSASSSVAESVAERVRESFRATDQGADAIADETADEQPESAALTEPGSVAPAVLFVAPEAGERPARRRRAGKAPA
ncbi:MAG: translation initiation factor IF-2 N-terminal domain-containing protein, partial [Actinomycetota bacterium]|nr:translation initiation factor IF-2 N-terminal domain-containing protein [Actinomycetota bacterium]